MRIDAHQHFWRLDRGDYGWLTPDLAPLYRDFGPEDLQPLAAQARVRATVLVQAAPTLAETEYLLGIAESSDLVAGVVGWADFEAPDAAQQIARLAESPWLLGLRPMIQDLPDDTWMLRDTLAPAFEAMIAAGLTFDALVLPRHLDALLTLLVRHPGLRVVIDHGAKPEIATGRIEDWSDHMARLAADTGAFCKLSGLITEAGPDWTTRSLTPYVGHLLKVFGPERLIWGSDWPVCTLAGSYGDWVAATEALLGELTPDQRRAVWENTARRAYPRLRV
ncbi:amidohydrolase family protein [Fluviibacterium sp. DFM31]|uniref:Amidohydrolase family protein n=1 Tax=Meridianimarinicoccus marinus TaxID=3231483 RepID=A0ABV3L5X1_9RHOB